MFRSLLVFALILITSEVRAARAIERSIEWPIAAMTSQDFRTASREIVESAARVGMRDVRVSYAARLISSPWKHFAGTLTLRFSVEDRYAKSNIDRFFLLKDQIRPAGYVVFEDLPKFSTLTQCNQLLSDARDIFKGFLKAPVVWFCGYDSSRFRATLYHLRIQPGYESVSFEMATDEKGKFLGYQSRDLCKNDMSRVIEEYRESSDAEVIGGLCGWPTSNPNEPARAFIYFAN